MDCQAWQNKDSHNTCSLLLAHKFNKSKLIILLMESQMRLEPVLVNQHGVVGAAGCALDARVGVQEERELDGADDCGVHNLHPQILSFCAEYILLPAHAFDITIGCGTCVARHEKCST